MANKGKQNRFAPKLKIKKGDKVVVIAGAYRDRSKVREVLEVLPTENRAIVDGVNIRKKHSKPTQTSPGGINEITAPIHISNVMLADPATGDPTRVRFQTLESGRKVRVAVKSGQQIDT